jgi:hypothetical protein
MKAEAIVEKSLAAVTINNETFYKISDVDTLRPFFMSIVSDANHWLFVSSNGGITAGRKNAEYALFPYYTDDKITESAESTGSKTLLRIEANGKIHTWEPFSVRSEGMFVCLRNVYKNRHGNKVIFEEINTTLGITFRYEWNSSNLFGFVRKASLLNHSKDPVNIALTDGLQNIMPYGVHPDLQQSTSNLADAYKRSELLPQTGLGIFALSAIIVDRAEPSEALKANVAWQIGFKAPTYLISSKQLNAIRKGEKPRQEEDVKAEKGAYFVCAEVRLLPDETKNWLIVANVNQSQSAVIALADTITNNPHLEREVLADVEAGTQQLVTLTASADGLQYSADDLLNTRHFANTLFNSMRGGIIDDNYRLNKNDFLKYLRKANVEAYQNYERQIPEQLSVFLLKEIAQQSGDVTFIRLATEYLPLRFSRRHGDPSRPWNKFSINTSSEIDGSKILDYEGNWRDIFQNWEALAHSYPAFIEGMIFKFLNASTFDGYNPYRVTKDGFDWEAIEPDNPWSYIGYWGDHQVIYLLKFLEFAQGHYPNLLNSLLANNCFVYANVPYIIKPYEQLLQNPKDTIAYSHTGEAAVKKRVAQLGADGALLTNTNETIHHVNFTEKMLAMLLAKLTNFVPEGGIWMNTQRPEWNDANNALVGNGVSMVTLYYLRRFLVFIKPLFDSKTGTKVAISDELHAYFNNVAAVFAQYAATDLTPQQKKEMLDALGMAGSLYRQQIYTQHFSGKTSPINMETIGAFIDAALLLIEKSIRANRRPDGLYHTYNILSYDNTTLSVSYLSEMLEGQVAVLSSGYLSAQESLHVLDALRASALYRPDQHSYILYPNKELPSFLQKNNVPVQAVQSIPLLQQLMADGGAGIIDRDIRGGYHFNGNFKNANDLDAALQGLDSQYAPLVQQYRSAVLEVFEEVFNHKAFTGRSGTFFAYEGLGSIYWHMVSKLLLAVQEICQTATHQNTDNETLHRLYEHFYVIKEGIGVHKSPSVYGAFPTDPYSHTPLGRGAQQPGMTGQVKEDILSRFGELGVSVTNGQLHLQPYLLRKSEFIDNTQVIEYIDVHQKPQQLTLPKGSLGFTYCQVPVVYTLADENSLSIVHQNGTTSVVNDLSLDEINSSKVFERTGEIVQINVQIKASALQ